MKQKLIENDKFLLRMLCLFIIIQPMLDILPLFVNPKYQLFGFTIPTLVRCGFIGLLAIIALKKIDKSKYKYLLIYLIILIVYTIIHHKVSSGYMSLPSNYVYSLSQELFYIVRMLLPLSIIYLTSTLKIKYKKFIKTIVISSAIIGTVIFVGNTLCISYRSYGTGKTVVNWIYWFFGDLSRYTFEELTSKGWFYMANQVSGLTLFLLPFNIYEVILNKTKLSTYSTLMLILSMIMLGTRTSAYGWIIIVVCTTLIYLYLKKIKKNQQLKSKSIKRIFLISIVGIIFLSFSPITRRNYGYEIGDTSSLQERPSTNEENNDDKVYEYILNSYKVYGVQEVYIQNIYNYQFDPGFWYNIFDYSQSKGVIENREMQRLISARITENNKNDIKYQLFGYSFSRMRNAQLYMEHDLIVQIFTMGYIGALLLLGPYLAIILVVIIKLFKKFSKKINLLDVLFIMSTSVVMCISVLTGHIFDELFITTYIGFVCGFFIKKINIRDILKEDN